MHASARWIIDRDSLLIVERPNDIPRRKRNINRAYLRELDKDIVPIVRYYTTDAMDDALRVVTAFVIVPHSKFGRSRARICSRKRRYPLTRVALAVRSDYQRIIPASDAL